MKSFLFLLSIFIFAGCGADKAIKATNEMPGKMDEMNTKMTSTEESIRLQKLAIAKENLENEDNAKTLLPVPTGLIAYAKLFAETATTEELVGQVYLYLKDVNDGVVIPDVDEAGNYVPFTAQQINKMNQYKLHRFTAAQAISAFIPQATLEVLINEQIVQDGRYKNTALSMLMMRFQFFRDVMLSGSLLSESMSGVGVLEKALDYAEGMELILKYPFASEIKIKITGFLAPMTSVEEDVATSGREMMSQMLVTIQSRADELKTLARMKVTADPELQAKIREENDQRLARSLQLLADKIAYWK